MSRLPFTFNGPHSEKSVSKQEKNGAVHLFRINAAGKATALDWDKLRSSASEPLAPGDWHWVHINRSDAAGRRWLGREAGLSTEVYEAMTNDDTEPRATEIDGGLLLILRGRNRDVGQRIADLVSIRLFMTERRIISVRLKPFAPTWRLAEIYSKGSGPATPSAFLDKMIDITLLQIEEGLDWIGAEIDQLEDLALTAPSGRLEERRMQLNKLKRAVVARRRYLRPQAKAISRLAELHASCLEDAIRPGLKEAADQTARIVEDLDELRERATIVADEMHARMTDRLNRTLVTLAVVSTVFLPLTVLTGLFGVNLEGIPFAGSSFAFSGFNLLLIFVAVLSIALVRRITKE